MTGTKLASMGTLAVAVLMLPGCINVAAPDKPIEINLNVNVKQEVVVRLQKDADDFIANNPELFPK
ncbi:YnbE family lipoprotein [Rhizorhabdus dicambivorans]|uniref:YnbE family lipoprotein n=1 Tax=Rhizorhabdus dicambivorans TaxID=1850238 RepID=A0A2A4FXH6_9SPHN|nr:YnbE family lipoprotein [Rhizorhabdus dicambivorans]ATE66030.1 YnbE family lipoprotein [Rhizorhabdus dicambivorans]PCE43149.1 YnbE family lipoprotein [Rhizorhabdus dicambivorans]